MQRVLDFLEPFADEQNYPPSITQISKGIDRGISTVKEQLDRLERMGKIRRTPGQARSIELVGRKRRRRPTRHAPRSARSRSRSSGEPQRADRCWPTRTSTIWSRRRTGRSLATPTTATSGSVFRETR